MQSLSISRLAAVGIALTTAWAAAFTPLVEAGGQGPEHESTAPDRTELHNASYEGVENLGRVTLAQGRWEGEPYVEGGAASPRLWLSPEFYLAGDLDGDGAEEAVAHLVFSSGGTGNYGYLAVMAREDGRVVQRALGRVGDRVQIRAGRIAGSSIELDVLQAGPDDGMCCPSELATRVFTMRSGQLEETASTVTGTPSLATLEGVTWVLREDPADEERPSISLEFKSGSLAGSAGCNRFNGSVSQGEVASSIAVGPLMTTRMACPAQIMDREQDFLARLEQSDVFRFAFGDLVLAGPGGSLIFVPGGD